MPDAYIAPEPHDHGPLEGGLLTPWRPAGSVYLCDCGTYVVRKLGIWKPVRWWHFHARQYIRQAAAQSRG